MADLDLAGTLDLQGVLDLTGDGGRVTVSGSAALVQLARAPGNKHGTAPAPVPIPPPPATPSDLGLDVVIFVSFNATVTASGKAVVAQGMCAQGDGLLWPGMVQPGGSRVTINGIPVNVSGDLGTILPSGAPVTFSTDGQKL